jgi:sulfur carrier protein
MKVLLRNPSRELDIDGRRRVHALLTELGLARESHLVIRNGTLVPGDTELDADDVVEIRPVISGGA